MSKVFFHPDINYQDIKKIEYQYNCKKENYLIEKASKFITDEIVSLVTHKSKILIICGPGSNGLDGIFVARNLYDKNYNIKIKVIQNDLHRDYLSKFNLLDIVIGNTIDFNSFDYIIDCIFGYGLNRELDRSNINLINRINQSRAFVISVDIPTGLDCSTGRLLPVSISCDFLITLLTYKKGLFTNYGRNTWKNITYTSLINEDLKSESFLLSANKDFNDSSNNNILIKDYKHKNKYSEHKKSNGISCIIAGEIPYHGALIMSCTAAIKTGCQYLHVITEPEYSHSLPIVIPEIISTTFSESNFEKEIKNYSNILIGPGITSIGENFVKIALDNLDTLSSLVIDAGGLLYLNKNNQYSEKLIITPHPGEAAKILNISVEEVQADRYKAANALHNMFNCIVI